MTREEFECIDSQLHKRESVAHAYLHSCKDVFFKALEGMEVGEKSVKYNHDYIKEAYERVRLAEEIHEGIRERLHKWLTSTVGMEPKS